MYNNNKQNIWDFYNLYGVPFRPFLEENIAESAWSPWLDHWNKTTLLNVCTFPTVIRLRISGERVYDNFFISDFIFYGECRLGWWLWLVMLLLELVGIGHSRGISLIFILLQLRLLYISQQYTLWEKDEPFAD